MKLLLDTHVFIWWVSDPKQLSPAVLAAFCDPANEMIISIASIWELQVKTQLGKLTLGKPLPQVITEQSEEALFSILPVTLAHIFAIGGLRLIHGDPFDRMLIAQSLSEQLTLVTKDQMMGQYGARVLW